MLKLYEITVLLCYSQHMVRCVGLVAQKPRGPETASNCFGVLFVGAGSAYLFETAGDEHLHIFAAVANAACAESDPWQFASAPPIGDGLGLHLRKRSGLRFRQ